jgi:hypothetical protein
MRPVHTQIRIHIHKQLRDIVNYHVRNQLSGEVRGQIYDQLYEQVRGGQISFQTKHNLLL